jgi:hypothetical protein
MPWLDEVLTCNAPSGAVAAGGADALFSGKHSGLVKWETRQCRVSTLGLFTVTKLFTTEGTEDHGEKPRLTIDDTDFGEAGILCRFTVHSCYRTDNLGRFYGPFILTEI